MVHDRDGFADALLLSVPKLRRVARALTSDTSAADDLVQQTLLKAWEHRDSLKETERVTAWAHMILRNTFRSSLRRREHTSEVWIGDTEDLHAAAEDTGLSFEARETLALIDQLDPELRDVLVITAVNGLSYQDAADALGIAVGTVKSRLNRARQELRVVIDGTLITDNAEDEGLATSGEGLAAPRGGGEFHASVIGKRLQELMDDRIKTGIPARFTDLIARMKSA